MMDDTRDIAIRTATKVEAVENKLDKALTALDSLREDLQQRRGAEKLARTLHTILGGTVGAAMVKGISWFGAIPK